MNNKLNIVIVGAGNVAHHLGFALQNAGHYIQQVVGRSKENTESLAKKLNTDYSLRVKETNTDVDLVVLAVSDGAIAGIVSQVDFGKTLVVHTSGSVPVDALSEVENHGVFYPLQTFSKNREVNFKDIPIFVEASSHINFFILKQLGGQLSNKVEECSSEQRKTLHLAAVFACNFSNHLYAIAESILEEHGLEFDHIAPLIQETSKKAIESKPKNVQTGPAIRNDEDTIAKHLKLLEAHPEFQKIYSFVSDSIRGTFSSSAEL